MNKGYYFLDSRKARTTRAPTTRLAASGHRPGREGRLLPGPADRLVGQDIRSEMIAVMGVGIQPGSTTTRSRPRSMSWAEVQHAREVRRLHADLQVCRPPGGGGVRQVGDLHAQAHLWRQRQGMHVHQSIWKGRQAAPSRARLRGPVETCLHYIGGIIGRTRAPNAFTNLDDQLYRRPASPASSGACDARLFGAQPLGVGPHSVLVRRRTAAIEVRFPIRGANPISPHAALLMVIRRHREIN